MIAINLINLYLLCHPIINVIIIIIIIIIIIYFLFLSMFT